MMRTSRIKNKEREVEKVAFEHRQTVLKDEEMMRYKEAEVKKTMEMEILPKPSLMALA